MEFDKLDYKSKVQKPGLQIGTNENSFLTEEQRKLHLFSGFKLDPKTEVGREGIVFLEARLNICLFYNKWVKNL